MARGIHTQHTYGGTEGRTEEVTRGDVRKEEKKGEKEDEGVRPGKAANIVGCCSGEGKPLVKGKVGSSMLNT